MYDTITKMPMIVWSPGRFEANKRIDGLCQQMDIGPAILELAEVDVPETMEARSLLPALEGKDWTPRDYVYAEHGKDHILDGTDYMSMVRSDQWKLVHFIGEDEGQLFNLHDDPEEVHNLWHSPEHSDTKQALLRELLEWRTRSTVQSAAWAGPFR
jgi:arylsulfatase A-like enzyme